MTRPMIAAIPKDVDAFHAECVAKGVPEDVYRGVCVYPDSVEQRCEGCGCSIMVGPQSRKQQAVFRMVEVEFDTFCFMCAVIHSAGQPVDVHDFGGSYAT